MDNKSLDDFMALNDHITALIRAGVPTGLGLGSSGDEAARMLEKVNASVARRVSRGGTFADALAEEHSAPAAYRRVMQAGWRSGNVRQALDNSSRMAEAVDEDEHRTRASFFYPLLVCSLALVGIAGFCLFVVPALAQLYQEFRIPESATLRLLARIRIALPYLVAGGLTLLAVVGIASIARRARGANRRRNSLGRFGWLTGESRTQFYRRCANFCEQLIALVNAGVPLHEGISLAAETCGDPALQVGARVNAVAAAQPDATTRAGFAAQQFPPFLRWALWNADKSISQRDALCLAAQVYRKSAEQRAARAQITIPVLACVFLGGGATLLYGLALFLPVTEMLKALAY
jgi:type II secretory pathway component PulF